MSLALLLLTATVQLGPAGVGSGSCRNSPALIPSLNQPDWIISTIWERSDAIKVTRRRLSEVSAARASREHKAAFVVCLFSQKKTAARVCSLNTEDERRVILALSRRGGRSHWLLSCSRCQQN